jgi:hypothetical protein
MLRLFLQHIEPFFGQEIREISCKAIFDSEGVNSIRLEQDDLGLNPFTPEVGAPTASS